MILRDKAIVITGGSLGIGFATAKKCAQEGAQVIIAARNKEYLERALESIREISDKGHDCYSLDVSNFNEVKAFAEWCNKKNYYLNALVNCAGIYGPIGKSTEIDMGDFANAININLLGTVFMCSAFAPCLVSKSNKKIINYSGGGAATPFPNYSAYAVSKTAIVRFTENLALELADKKIDVNCIAPGFVVTRLHEQTLMAGPENAGPSFYDNTKKQIESGGVSAEKAADLTAFLISEMSDGITGKFISAPWDPWRDLEFQELLKTDKDIATIRRIDNKYFKKI